MSTFLSSKTYFTLEEFIASSTAKSLGIDNTPSPEHLANIKELVSSLLDPIREAWGKYCKENNLGLQGINITSGYRSPALNKAIPNSSTTSAHSLGYAADTKPANGNMKEYQEFVKSYLKQAYLAYDQYILEEPNSEGIASWIHLGLKNNSGLQRKQDLLYKNKKYINI